MSNPEADQNCGVCRFNVVTHSAVEAKGEQAAEAPRLACRRFPPNTHFIVSLRGNPLAGQQQRPVEEQRSAFPPVMADWNCGEWAPAISLTS